MTDREALLAAVVAHPDDDTFRLILADWLEENGDNADRVRASFIRRQCARAATYAPNVPLSVLVELDPYLGSYLWPHQYTFNGSRKGEAEVRYWLDRDRLEWGFFYRRGFVDEVRCPLAAWLQHGPELVRRHPIIRVVLTDREPVREVGAHPNRGTEWWRAYCRFEGPDMNGVTRLHRLREAALGGQSAACLAWARGQGRSKE